jgi:hypothetical protein
MRRLVFMLVLAAVVVGGCACEYQRFERKTDEFYYLLNHWDPTKCDCR